MPDLLRHAVTAVLLVLLLVGCDSTSVGEAPLRINLDAPVLLSPLDGQTLDATVGIGFRWRPVGGALRYDVEIAQSSSDQQLLIRSAAGHNFTFRPASPGVITWRVRAPDLRGRAGYWSERRSLSAE